jgi:SAM-dependent methyltransferase
MKSKLKSIFKKIYPSTDMLIEKLFRQEIKKSQSVLDLGCGPHSPLKMLKKNPDLNLYSVGVDIFSPYIKNNIEIEKIHTKIIEGNILEIDFPENSFGCAIMIDVVEHIKKEDFINFLPKLEKIAKKIIIITPNDFIEQDTYDENIYQRHLSGWTVSDFEELGFKCVGLSGLKSLRKELWIPKIKPQILGSMVCDMSQPFVYKRPKLAFHIAAIKNRQ